MIEVFKTNVRSKAQAKEVLTVLNSMFAGIQANFDLQDADKILRMQGFKTRDLPRLKSGLAGMGFRCEILA